MVVNNTRASHDPSETAGPKNTSRFRRKKNVGSNTCWSNTVALSKTTASATTKTTKRQQPTHHVLTAARVREREGRGGENTH